MNRPLTEIDPHDADLLVIASELRTAAVRMSYTFRDEADMERLLALFRYTPDEVAIKDFIVTIFEEYYRKETVNAE